MVDSNDAAGTTAVLYVIVVVAAVLIGTVLAPVAWGAASQSGADGKPTVAVVTLQGSITANSVDAVTEDLREARQNESIEAVVLEVNSPGGGVGATEQLYMSVERTADEMPVVAAVTSQAASGGYYAIAPADAIYVSPGTIVGSVGVYAQVQSQPDAVPDQIVRSGPDKATRTRDQIKEQVEILQRTFVDTVQRHRGDRLDLERDELAHAKVYTGVRGVENGLADDVGDVNAAVARAAEESDEIGDDYEVRYVEPPETGGGVVVARSENGEVVVTGEPFSYEGVDTVRYLALHGTVATDDREVTANATR